MWSGNVAYKSRASNDCCTGQTASHLRSLRHLLWFPTQIMPVPEPPIEPTNLVAQLVSDCTRSRRRPLNRDSIRAGMIPTALTALLRANGDSAVSATATVTRVAGPSRSMHPHDTRGHCRCSDDGAPSGPANLEVVDTLAIPRPVLRLANMF